VRPLSQAARLNRIFERSIAMSNHTSLTYPTGRTALLLVDPYNDFLSSGGKLFPMIEAVARDVRLLDNLRAAVGASRNAGLRVFYVPHRRWQPGDYDNWDHPNPTQRLIQQRQTFAKGTWGGEWHPDFVPQPQDIVISEHWGQSGFPNTDLDFQLKQHGITHVIAVGLLANTCIESTARFAMEFGYHVTLVRDATAAFSPELMRVSHELNGPTYAHEIVTTAQLLAAVAA
jgi:nicotinamidase-related amidase